MANSTTNYGFPTPDKGNSVLPASSDFKKLADSVDAQIFRTEQQVDSAIPYRGFLDEQTGTLDTLAQGRYAVRYVGTAPLWGIPHALIGDLIVTHTGAQKEITFKPNDASAGFGIKSEYTLGTDANGQLRDRWQRVDRSIMRTAPVVLTAPSGEYPQSNSRGAVRLPFRVPTNVSKVRVHMRPWNFRTGKQWGPARLNGVMISQQSSGGTITGSRWYAPNVDGQTVDGAAGWTSDWFYVGLTPGPTFLLSYAAEWLDDVRDLVLGECWSNFDLSKWDSTEDAIYQNGWGGFYLQPMDVWIECEAPSSVPIIGYVGPSNAAGVDCGGPFYAYPTLHALRNGAFCALTAAGGWSIMDSSMHDSAIINRFGYPARIVDKMFLELGANIEARDATAAEAMVEMERWMNTRLPSLGSPPVHLMTQISRYTSEGTTDTAGTMSDWNQWIRWTAAARPEVVGLFDQAAIFADPEKPWTARKELRVSEGNVHFNRLGQKLRAAAMDGEVHLPMDTARDESEMGANAAIAAYQAVRGGA